MRFSQLTDKHKMNLRNQSTKKTFLRTLCIYSPTTLYRVANPPPKKGPIAGTSQDHIKMAFWLFCVCVWLLNILNINFGFSSKTTCDCDCVRRYYVLIILK